MKLSVLVVDQDPSVRGALARLLEDRGHRVMAVASRAQGFEVLDEVRFDLLILDDPAQERCYRLVWLTEDVPDARVELFDTEGSSVAAQLEGFLRGAEPQKLTDSGVIELPAHAQGAA